MVLCLNEFKFEWRVLLFACKRLEKDFKKQRQENEKEGEKRECKEEACGGHLHSVFWQRVWILMIKYICNVCKHCRYIYYRIFIINVQRYREHVVTFLDALGSFSKRKADPVVYSVHI